MPIDPSAIEDLVSRVDASFGGRRGRVIGFIASGAGEGSSSLAKAYAGALTTHLRRRVLLLKADRKGPVGTGILQALAAKRALTPLVRTMSSGSTMGSLGGREQASSLGDLIARDDLWEELRHRYDDVVLDLPSTERSRLGLAVAPHCDGVIVVLEAEKTRAPVAASLIERLNAVRANILGTVLNKRRYHLPDRVYRWL